MRSGDGLLMRLRLPGGRITAQGFARVARIAARHGNGHVDLTALGNLQIRGVVDGAAASAELVAAGLAVAPAEAESARNIVASAAADVDPCALADSQPLVRELDAALQNAPDLWQLPPKFRFVIDGGGASSVAMQPGDIRADAVPAPDGTPVYRLALAGTAADAEPLGCCAPQQAGAAMLALARAFLSLQAELAQPAARMAEKNGYLEFDAHPLITTP